MNKDQILQDFEQVFSDFRNNIALFENERLNQVPFEGSWTAGQVIQHVVLSSEGFGGVLNGTVTETERPIDQYIPMLKDIFLNFSTKLKSPDFILPELKDYDQDDFLVKTARIKQEVSKAIADLPLDKTCLDFQFPGIGHLTRLEAISFVTYHTKRHNHQLSEINRYLKSSTI